MGNIWNNTYLKKSEVAQTILNINEKMKKPNIIELIGANINFILNNINNKNRIISANINITSDLAKVNHKMIYLTLEQFYQYYNALIDCIDALDNKECEKSFLSIEKKLEDQDNLDSDLCPICNEKKFNISLPCKHFFCQDCIKNWMIKSETCPICRTKLKKENRKEKLLKYDVGIYGVESWYVMEVDLNILAEARNQSINLFLNLNKKLFNI